METANKLEVLTSEVQGFIARVELPSGGMSTRITAEHLGVARPTDVFTEFGFSREGAEAHLLCRLFGWAAVVDEGYEDAYNAEERARRNLETEFKASRSPRPRLR